MGFQNPQNYNDNEGFCGGFTHQYEVNGGKCGICGDAWDANPREHEVTSGCTEMSIAMIVCLCG